MDKIIIENTSLAKACDDSVKKWKFKDREAMLYYVIAIMLEAETTQLIVEKRNEFGLYDAKPFKPADHLIK